MITSKKVYEKKYFSFIIYFLIVLSSCQKELDNAALVADSTAKTDVYVAGTENNGGKSIPKYWKNGSPVILGDVSKYSESKALSIFLVKKYAAICKIFFTKN